MNWFALALVIFLTALAVLLGAAVLTGRKPRIPVERLADPAPLPGELPRAGYFDLPDALRAVYGPFPVDTGPLLILSEQAAANVALEREIRQRCAEAEAKIPPRWR